MLSFIAALLIAMNTSAAPPVKPPIFTLVQPSPTPTPVEIQEAPVVSAPAYSGSVWDAVAACEGGGDWSLYTTGNGYYFVLQFVPSTWLANGGTQAELDAGHAPSRDRIIQVAESVLASQGSGAWPNCFP